MTIKERDARFAREAKISTDNYRGPDRRRTNQTQDDVDVYQTIISNPSGEVILDVRTNARRRREDDMTVNLLKCLDIAHLEIEDFDD